MNRRSNIKVMAGLIGLVKPLAGFMLLAITMGLVGNLCATFITVLGGMAILTAMGIADVVSVKMALILAVIFAIIRGVLRYAEQSCNHYIAFKLLAHIRNLVFGAIRNLCPAKLDGRNKGNLVAIITSDIELLEVFYAHTVSPIAIWILYTIVMSTFIGSYNMELGTIALLAYVMTGVVIPVVISKLGKDLGMRYRNASGSLSSFVLDSLRGLTETIQYGIGAKRLKEMNESTDKLLELESKMKKNVGVNVAVTNTVILVWDFVMIFAASLLYIRGDVGFDGVVIAVIALMSSFGPSVALANLGSTLQNTMASGNRVLDILEETPVVKDVVEGKDVEFGGAAASNVTFSYEEEDKTKKNILQDFSMEVEANGITGIVGRSGSGKSTFLKLLMRFYDTDKGSVNISGENIKNINTKNLRKMESYMTQETHLFAESIADNIRIAKLDATDEEIIEACKKASIHDFIMGLKGGYKTQVGELGDTLSGGEKQRIGLARVFLHNAPFILLDEPTSNLDSLNEAVILKSLKEQSKGKSVILVSHRLSTMRIADKVYSVEKNTKKFLTTNNS